MPDHSPSTDERASLAQPSQSSSPLECTSHLGFSLVLVGIITGWILYQKRQKSWQGTDDQNNESLGLVLSTSTDQEYDNYEVLEVNQSQSSDREYELLGHLVLQRRFLWQGDFRE